MGEQRNPPSAAKSREKTSVEGMDAVKKLMSAGASRRAWLIHELGLDMDLAGFTVCGTSGFMPEFALAEIERVEDFDAGYARRSAVRYFDVYLKNGRAFANIVYVKTGNGRRRLCFNPWFSVAYSADGVLRWYGKKCRKFLGRARTAEALEVIDLNLTALGLG